MDIWKDFGLNGLIMGSVVALLFFVIKWTLETTKEILVQAAKERECWHAALGSINKAIDDHTAQAKAFHESVNEAHRFQREEHKEMIKVLGRINGYKDE